jgi:hypothetical protein
LDNHGIHRRIMQGLEFGDGIIQFIREDEHIQRDIGFHAVCVEEGGDSRKFVFSEVISPHAGVEAAQAKENGIGAICHSGAQTLPIASGREEFGFDWTDAAQ